MTTTTPYDKHMTIEFDAKFDDAGEVTSFPWVGKNYHQSEILILGEATYGEDELRVEKLDHDTNRKIAAWWWRGDWVQQFKHRKGVHKNTCKMFVDNWLSPQNRIAFWESVAFVNHCQCAVGKSDTNEDCPCPKESDRAFYQVVGILKPKLVIVWGVELADHLEFKKIHTLRIGRTFPRIKEASGDSPAMVGIKHPSGRYGFSPRKWHKFLSDHGISKQQIARLQSVLK